MVGTFPPRLEHLVQGHLESGRGIQVVGGAQGVMGEGLEHLRGGGGRLAAWNLSASLRISQKV
jgi:hypothetical protein